MGTLGTHSPRLPLDTAIVGPTLTYGAVVWVSCLEKGTNRVLISRVLCICCMQDDHSMGSSTTIGMASSPRSHAITEVVGGYAIASGIRIEKSVH